MLALVGWLLATAGAATAAESLSPPEAQALSAHHEAVLVDVRTPREWADTGIPAGAATATWGADDFLDRMLSLAHGDRTQPVVLICRTGNRSGRALAYLTAQGFTAVRHVPEGMAGSAAGPGWLARGLPVEDWRRN